LRDSPDNIEYITQKFNVAKGDFNQQAPHFRADGYEGLLLPLFAQMANMHLSLLRDGAIHGNAWGWSDKIVDDLKRELKKTIDDYTKHVDDTYKAELSKKQTAATNIIHSDGRPERYVKSFNLANGFVREMTLSVLDYRQMWPCMDISAYPKPVYILLTREVYSDAGGVSHTPIVPRPEPTGRMLTSCRIRSATKIDSVSPAYNGVETDPMGGNGGWEWKDFTWVPATMGQVTGWSWHVFDAVFGLAFEFEHHPVEFLGDYKHQDWDTRRQALLDGHYVSSILATPDPMTASGDLVRSVYFGFKLKRAPIFDLPDSPDPKTFWPDLPGVLISGGFATEETRGWTSDQQRNHLIDVLAKYLKPSVGHFQSLSDYDLIGTGAALGLLRLIKFCPDDELKDADEDGVHNKIIVAIGTRMQPLELSWMQRLNNLELAIMARGLA
jgi:delta endotoxin, N-terminal domain